jgi:hypothetical protein
MENKSSSDPSIEKILISVSEYDRLLKVESNYEKLMKKKEKFFDNHSQGKNIKLIKKVSIYQFSIF